MRIFVELKRIKKKPSSHYLLLKLSQWVEISCVHLVEVRNEFFGSSNFLASLHSLTALKKVVIRSVFWLIF